MNSKLKGAGDTNDNKDENIIKDFKIVDLEIFHVSMQVQTNEIICFLLFDFNNLKISFDWNINDE